jgi:hypothetical protein
MPDWYYVENITDDQAHHLVLLQDLRTDDPVIWALIQGLHTSESIAKLINWPHTYTLNRLRALKNEGLVWDSEGRASVIWALEPNDDHDELQRWVTAQKQPGGLFRRIDRNDE